MEDTGAHGGAFSVPVWLVMGLGRGAPPRSSTQLEPEGKVAPPGTCGPASTSDLLEAVERVVLQKQSVWTSTAEHSGWVGRYVVQPRGLSWRWQLACLLPRQRWSCQVSAAPSASLAACRLSGRSRSAQHLLLVGRLGGTCMHGSLTCGAHTHAAQHCQAGPPPHRTAQRSMLRLRLSRCRLLSPDRFSPARQGPQRGAQVE